MSEISRLLQRLHCGLSAPAVASFGTITMKLRAYYLLPVFLLPPLIGGNSFDRPLNHEIMTYRAGWALGGIAKGADGELQENTLDGVLSEMPHEDHEWFEEGFADGLKGRNARHEVPDDLFD